MWNLHYDGTMRIERHASGVTASGDLYSHSPFRFVSFPSFRLVRNTDASPSAGIPIFPRNRYRYYLRVTQILEYWTFGSTFVMKFELFRFNSGTNTWTNQGVHSAKMTFTSAPANYPSGATYLKGDLISPVGVNLGPITMGWVSKYLRKATVEVDRVSASEYPGGNGGGEDWKSVFDDVDWDLNVYESGTKLEEPSGESWSDA